MDVLLVDDHPLMQEMLAAMVKKVLGQAVVRTASDLENGLEIARDCERLELVLLDLGLPGCSGIEALTRFRAKHPTTRIIVVSGNEESATIRACLEAGAVGFIPKTFKPPSIIDALRSVAKGQNYVPYTTPVRLG